MTQTAAPDENPEEPTQQNSEGAIVPASHSSLSFPALQHIRNDGNNVRASWNFSLSDVRSHLAHCIAERKQILIDCFLWSIDPHHPTTLTEFAAVVEYDVTVVRRIYQGKYADQSGKRYDIPQKMATKAKAWLSVQKKRFQGRDEFVLTPTAQRIWTTLDLARKSKTVAFILGPSHIGKTWALENYSVRNNHGSSPYIRMKAASGLGGMVRRISGQLGNTDNGNVNDLIERIKLAVSPDMLLIFDELHLLMYTYRLGSFFACLEVLREIHDEKGCGMALCGTQLLMEKIKGGQHTEMEQLVRRGVHKLILPDMPTKADLTAILERNGLEFPEKDLVVRYRGIPEKPYALLRQLAKTEGLLSICERIREARNQARKKDAEIGWYHFVEADLLIRSQAKPTPDWD